MGSLTQWGAVVVDWDFTRMTFGPSLQESRAKKQQLYREWIYAVCVHCRVVRHKHTGGVCPGNDDLVVFERITTAWDFILESNF